jgi:hypothetical protein
MTIGSVRLVPGPAGRDRGHQADDDLLSAGLTKEAQAAIDATLARLRRGSS